MDNIRKLFLSLNDDDDKFTNENDKLDVNSICNEFHNDQNEITRPRFDSVNETGIRGSNQNLIRRIKSLEEENDRLLSIIENKNNLITDGVKCSCKNAPDYAAKKIIQLTENVEELKSELEIIKSSAYGDHKMSVQGDYDSIKVKQLIDELNLSNKKNFGYRNHIKQLKNNLQIAQNALLNEVGNPEVMQAVLSDTGSPNSIGRAQQILILQQKVKELEAKQNCSNDKFDYSSKVTIKKFEKAREVDHQALKDAQLKICKLSKMLDKLKCQREASELGINALRMQKQELLSKSEFDKQLIDKLKAELEVNNTKLSRTKESILKLEGLVKSQISKSEKAQEVIEEQASILNDKNETIANLKLKVLKYEETISNRNTCTMNFSDPKDDFIKKLDDFENQQLKEILCLAHDHICDQIVNFKDKCLTNRQKSQKNMSRVELLGSFTSVRQTSNNILCKLKTESNEKLNELQYKLEQAEEECAALKDKLDILVAVHKKHVRAFKETLSKQYDDAIHKLNAIIT